MLSKGANHRFGRLLPARLRRATLRAGRIVVAVVALTLAASCHGLRRRRSGRLAAHLGGRAARSGCCRRGTPRRRRHGLLPRRLHRPGVDGERQFVERQSRTAAPRPRARSGVALHRRRTQPDVRDGREDRRGLPGTRAGQPKGILLIGVGVSRFIGPPRRGAVCRRPAVGSGLQNLSLGTSTTTTGAPRSRRAQEENSCRAGGRRWTGFVLNKRKNLDAIERSSRSPGRRVCRPVLFDLPLDVAVVGHGLDRPRNAIRYGCRGLAAKYSIQYLGFTGRHRSAQLGLLGPSPPARPGYTRWQSRLSAELVRMLPKASATLSSAVLPRGRGRRASSGALAAGPVARSPGLPGAERGTCCP